MKRIISLLVILCIVFLSVTVFAEIFQTDGNPLDFDDFTMNFEAGTKYNVGSKVANELYAIIFPNSVNDDLNTNIAISWAGTTDEITIDQVRENTPTKEAMTEIYRANGIILDSMEYNDPVESILAGAACIVHDSNVNVSVNGHISKQYQRIFYVGTKGYMIIISSPDQQSIESVTTQLNDVLSWK